MVDERLLSATKVLLLLSCTTSLGKLDAHVVAGALEAKDALRPAA